MHIETNGTRGEERLEHFVFEQKSRFHFQVQKGHLQAQKSRFEVVLGLLHQYQYSIDWSLFSHKKDLTKSKPRGLFLYTLVRSFLYKSLSLFLSKLPVFFSKFLGFPRVGCCRRSPVWRFPSTNRSWGQTRSPTRQGFIKTAC